MNKGPQEKEKKAKSLKKSKSNEKEVAKEKPAKAKKDKEKQPKQKKEKPEGQPKKPQTAYFLFCADKRAEMKDKSFQPKSSENFSKLCQKRRRRNTKRNMRS